MENETLDFGFLKILILTTFFLGIKLQLHIP